MMNGYTCLSRLHGGLFRNADRLRGVEREVFFDLELLTEYVFGTCSYLLKGKKPLNFEDRLHWMGQYFRPVHKLHTEIQYEWSGRDRYLWFVLMMHAWVLLTFMEDEEEIQTIPRELENIESTDLGIVLYFMQDLGRHDLPSIGSEFVESFRYCQNVVTRGLVGEIVPSEFAEARLAFEKLERLFDTLWSDEARCVALRGYLAGLGFCLSWLEIREELTC